MYSVDHVTVKHCSGFAVRLQSRPNLLACPADSLAPVATLRPGAVPAAHNGMKPLNSIV